MSTSTLNFVLCCANTISVEGVAQQYSAASTALHNLKPWRSRRIQQQMCARASYENTKKIPRPRDWREASNCEWFPLYTSHLGRHFLLRVLRTLLAVMRVHCAKILAIIQIVQNAIEKHRRRRARLGITSFRLDLVTVPNDTTHDASFEGIARRILPGSYVAIQYTMRRHFLKFILVANRAFCERREAQQIVLATWRCTQSLRQSDGSPRRLES